MDFQDYIKVSELRKNLYAWYDLKPDGDLLEIGGDCVPITELFKEKCRMVDSLEQGYPVKRYDYIILTGVLEKLSSAECADYLSSLKENLKSGGRILLAVNNRYGSKYFCGECEENTGWAFDGIRNYPGGTGKGRAFARQELIDIITSAGLQYKFYYPLSDYKFTQLVYTDACLPTKNLQERIMPYYMDKSTLIADERAMYHDIIDNGVFPFFANSFLVECGLEKDFCKVKFAAVSSDRLREDACITVIYEDNTVRKLPFYEEGKPSMHQQYENLMELSRHGVKIIPHTLKGDSLIMPYVPYPKLSDKLREIVRVNQDIFVEILDRLYEIILHSSDEVSPWENALANEETKAFAWGRILRKASIELIPLNCFYVDGELHFFDQEFVFENYPAKFVMFRALYYVYRHAPETEGFVPEKEMKERYGMTDLWKIFQQAEQEFQARLHVLEELEPWRAQVGVDSRKIDANIRRLMMAGVTTGKNIHDRFEDIFKNIGDKRIVIFGAGAWYEDYMKRFSERYAPIFIADNDNEKWGTIKCGVPVKSPKELRDGSGGKLRVIICSIHYRSIAAQLERMGIHDYKIYTKE